MIKIIKENPKKKTTCPCCRSILEYEFEDVSTQEFHGTLDIVKVNYLLCPVCDAKIYNV